MKTEEIGELIGIPINKNERKGRTRKQYFDELHEGQSAKKEVLAWFKANPKGTQTRCSQELGISRKTVSKWWPARKKGKKPQKEAEIKNPCPVCGAEMTKTKVGPHFWEQKSKFYARIDNK